MHKSGFVNIVGNPNVGKSTLMNLLVGERISIATFKAQTTRHRIMGIINDDEAQIVFSDTPGVLKPNYKLQESMLAFSESALADADVLLYVTDVIENPEKNIEFLEKVQKMTVPVLLLINKIDSLNTPTSSKGGKEAQEKLNAIVEKWNSLLPCAEILPISALNKFGTEVLLKRIKELLPDSPPLFRQGPVDGQARQVLCQRDHSRENLALLRQGNPLFRGSARGKLQGNRQEHPHSCHHLRGARQPERDRHRTPGRGIEKSIHGVSQVAGALLWQKHLS